MAKTAKKSRSELEVLRGENRKLKSENKHLRRENKALQRRSHFFEEIVDEVVEEVDVKNVCRNCGKGQLLEYDVGYISLIKCNTCDYEKKTKKGLND